MKTYPYDWKGTNAANAFTEDRILESEVASDRVLVLKHRPFFGNSLTVTLAGSTTPLTLGADYELAYQLPQLDDSVASEVWCGVNIINPAISGPLHFAGQLLGDSFYSPFIDILDDLVKYLNNPVDADWLNFTGRPQFYPPQPAATSWADLVNKKYVASAVHDIEVDAGTVNDAIKAKLNALKVLVNSVHDEIVAFNYPAHIAAHNPHNTTVAQNGAHPVNLKTPDTFLAYGKTLRSLTAEIRALGLRQTDIDKYIEKWACKDVSGVFVQTLAPNRQLFKSKAGDSEITFTDTAFTLTSKGSVVLAAGYDESTAVKFMEWKAGTNTLRIESSGSALGMDKLTLNGVVLLNTTLLKAYQGDGSGNSSDPDDNKLYIEGRGGITFTGKGSRLDPVSGVLTVPDATTTTKGVAKLKSGPGSETAGVAATPDSIKPYESKTQGYVPKTLMLNSKAMDDGARVMTKADLGLDLASNLRDINKPVSDDQQDALDDLSAKNHKHAWAELGLVNATTETYGLGRFTNNPNGLSALKGVTPNILKDLSDRLDIVAQGLVDVKTGTVTDFAAVNTAQWLVSGTKRGLSVQDLGYFYLLNGSRGDGVYSGSIDLQTTPMFNWFSPDNTMEKTWPASVASAGTGITFTGISQQPPLSLDVVPVIGITAGQMGNLAIVSLLTKQHLRSISGKMKFYVAGGGKVTIYVDGIEAASGNSPLYAEVDVEAEGVPHAVGIRVDCNDSTKSAAMAFEIYDDQVPLARSYTGMPIVQLSEFVKTPDGLRHFLYLNMNSGSMFSRAEPILSTGVDIERALIGYIDVPVGGITASALTFQKTFDYGTSKEISEHIVKTAVHTPTLKDWYLSDNLNMVPMGKLRFEPEYAVNHRGGISGFVYDRSLIRFNRSTDVTAAGYLLYSTECQGPQLWHTPKNPKADGRATLEGGLVLNSDQVGAGAVMNEVPLIFMGQPEGDTGSSQRNKMLRLVVNATGASQLGHCKVVTAAAGAVNVLRSAELITMPVTKTVLQSGTSTDPSVLDLPSLNNQSPRVMFRYRYTVETRTLRVLRAAYYGAASAIDWVEVEYEFGFDALPFMRGFVGVQLAYTPVPDAVTFAPTVMKINIPEIDATQYHYFRSLFESYVDTSAEKTTTETNGLRHLSVDGFFQTASMATEWESLPVSEGNYRHSHAGQLSAAFWTGLLQVGSVAIPGQSATSTSWRQGWTEADSGVGHNGPIGIGRRLVDTYKVGKVEVDIASSFPVTVQVGCDAIAALQATADAVTSNTPVTLSIPVTGVRARSGLAVYLSFTPPPHQRRMLKCQYTVRTYDLDGVLQETYTHNDVRDILHMGPRVILERRNPFHITQAVWDFLSTEMNAERSADGTDYGRWA